MIFFKRSMTTNSDSESKEEEFEKGPDIFEAAADEEITETHWCEKKRIFFQLIYFL